MVRDDGQSFLCGQAALDAEVWTILAGADAALTVVEVQHGLTRRIVYSTVLSSLRRLFARGDVDRLRHGRTIRYSASDDGAGVAAREMLRALDATGTTGRSAAIARFASIVDESDRAELLHAVSEAGAIRRPECSRSPHLRGTR